MIIRRGSLALLVVGALSAGCTKVPVVQPGPATPEPSFRPTATTPQSAVDLLRDAWRDGDEQTAADLAPEEIVSTLFRVSPRGWGKARFTGGAFRLTKKGVPGHMEWRIQSIGGRYYVNVVDVPPIPLTVSDLKGPAWGLYLAAGGSGYSQLAAASTQLRELGLSSSYIATFPASCQASVAERLEIPSSYYTVSVFFERKSDAQEFEGWIGFPPLKLLKVKAVGC